MSSHSAGDGDMQKMMVMVGIALTVLTLIIVIAANMLSIGSNDEFDQLLHNAQMDRIQPVGQVRTTAPVAVQVADAAPRPGADLIQGACAGCHTAGVAGAPKFTDKAEWDKRATAGLEALVASVINGKGSMPAGGGTTYTEAEITRAVEYMTGLGTGGDLSDAPAAVETETDETAAVSESAEPEEAASESATAEAVSGSAGTDQAAATAAVETDVDAGTTEASAPTGLSDSLMAALTPRIQTTVDQGVCSGCHESGVAGSPKFDDATEWAKRAEKGYAALAETVKTGKAAMPPRGGSDLTDDELLIAVEYMVEKSKL